MQAPLTPLSTPKRTWWSSENCQLAVETARIFRPFWNICVYLTKIANWMFQLSQEGTDFKNCTGDFLRAFLERLSTIEGHLLKFRKYFTCQILRKTPLQTMESHLLLLCTFLRNCTFFWEIGWFEMAYGQTLDFPIFENSKTLFRTFWGPKSTRMDPELILNNKLVPKTARKQRKSTF